MDPFRVRLNCIDHYQAVPLDEFDPPVPQDVATTGNAARDRPRISVIRVFGATETGQKVLMHIHGALQYTYIEYSGSLVREDVDVAIRTLQLSIDHALAVSYRKNIYEGKHRYVAHISLVKGIPFYGFHVGNRFYLKIYLLNPLHMTRLADLLREGAVMKRVLQPYESHLQYLAQWMCDYNLYGCGYIECEKVKFRGPVPKYHEMNSLLHQWHDHSIPPEFVSDEAALPKQSHCTLEVDVHVKDILNRRDVHARELHHDFVEQTHPLPADAKLVQSMAGLWKDETRRRKLRMGIKDNNSSPFPPEVLVSMSADPRNTSAGGWIHEEEFRQKVEEIANEERVKGGQSKVSFETFVKSTALEASVQTALGSVEDLYPHNMRSKQLAGATDGLGMTTNGDQDVLEQQSLVDEEQAEHIADTSEPSFGDQQVSDDGSSGLGKSGGSSDPVNGQSNGHLMAPISPSEYEQYGIRAAGNVERLDRDAFEVPEDYLNQEPASPNRPKRMRFASVPSFKPRKRRKQLVDDENVLPDVSFSGSDEDPDFVSDQYDSEAGAEPTAEELRRIRLPSSTPYRPPASSQAPRSLNKSDDEGAAPPNLSQQSTLSFPTVKNPNDPSTILRLSQKSVGSAKSSQPSDVKPPISPVLAKSPARNGNHISSKASHIEPQTSPVLPKTPGSKGVQDLSRRSDTKSSTSPALLRTPASKSIQTSSQPTLVPPATGGSVKSTSPELLTIKGLPSGRPGTHWQAFQARPPGYQEVEKSLGQYGLPDVIYQDAYYSNESDVPEQSREYAGREFKLESTTVPYLPDFDPTGTSPATFGRKPPTLLDVTGEGIRENQRRKRCRISEWVICEPPPRKAEVLSWLDQERKRQQQQHQAGISDRQSRKVLSQIDGPTQKNKYGFKYSQKQVSTSVQHETQYMSIMALEVHVNTRGSLAPNPEEDAVSCIFWCLQTDDEDVEANMTKGSKEGTHMGIIAVGDQAHIAKRIGRTVPYDVEEEETELDALTRLVDIVRYYDPDILTGYEVHNSSWGYLIERARVKYDLNYCDELSRMKAQSHGRFGRDDDRWGFNHTSTIRVTGRHTINIWRAMRGELNLLQYTMENVVYHLLHQRIPHYAFVDLTRWYRSKNPRNLAKVVEYFCSRVQMDIEILDANELVPRTSEQARLLGVDWFSVISRGSQFKVESLMFRIAKPENFILVSPSRRQVGGQNALECLPLVMEPRSDFYTSPLLVLDFQSLYPSVMIAYNYCYSTFLGRVVSWRGTNKMGFTDYRREPRLLELLKEHINIAPNGIMYAKPHIRKSLLAKMLSEILETRVMVKSGMKVDKDDKTLQRLLNNRQLALKLIANVTYGYTSASFSGRMPCSEIADSIVQTGRETLEKAIALIHSVDRWGAEVVYGDTDSLFVYLKGRTRDQAFDIGEEIAAAVTNMNPRPVKLKFEKVYHPCVLLAKKRYVGFKYESRNQTVPDFDAKGIETVRRDGTPAEQKIEETALKLLFRTADLSQVKRFFQAQCAKIMRGNVSIQDFCFAREVKLGTYSDKGPPPPGALISARRMMQDPRLEPQYGERVPYVVVTGGPGARLIDRCVAPEVLLNDPHAELDAEYYISKNIIPPLERIFNLVGANVRQWYDEMPKYQRIRRVEGVVDNQKRVTLESYLKSSTCLVCRELLDGETRANTSAPAATSSSSLGLLCSTCRRNSSNSILTLRARLVQTERKVVQLAKVCRSCSGLAWNEEVKCDSKDCPVFYSRTRQNVALANEQAQLRPVLEDLERQDDLADGLDW
ncbi:DNA polymerase zeta [Exophiala dermatitidis]|uniref:DNA polymerase n=1 Tax=Exophiala dermatitidis TaxID=5970 RepID=A0AAN6F5L9_EXODE|nr:DNA polymerase zeta [Exophiala dermatitidis]KAJ4527925.1 DNA polymerase zeta [Exophiala dermatitidis]KAJ4528559.1 DNA polymerase zeta [Exophiala dermatitidis]KAJ4529931.1 DNA polymerase zeta [Exophiala dermatitidis]KAJ4552914.1 DNA polymerase zeta [Exophiala dermatitidis]